MIYTIALNPALDIVYTANNLVAAHNNFAESTQKFPGGKSVNVSRMLYNLGVPSLITGFVGGYPGGFVKKWFEDHQLENKLIEIDEDSSTNVKVKTPSEQLVIKGKKPRIPIEKLEELLFFLSRIREGDIVVLGGSIPENVDPDIYVRIAEICQANRAESVIDVYPNQMIDLLKYKPLLIKPNIDNLSEMFGLEKLEKEEDIIKYAKKCQELGAKNVIVTMSEKGSYLFTEDGENYRCHGVKGEEVNSFNAKDAMIAVFIGVYMKNQDIIEAYRMGAAAASATAFVEDIADADLTREVYAKTIIEKIED